jgi:hypothetical protein
MGRQGKAAPGGKYLVSSDLAQARSARPAPPAELEAADDDAERLRRLYGGMYDTGPLDGRWWAFRLTGGPVLEAATAAELEVLIRADRDAQ